MKGYFKDTYTQDYKDILQSIQNKGQTIFNVYAVSQPDGAGCKKVNIGVLNMKS